MTLPFWGSQEKAVDNNKTIDTAIAEAIAAHNDDPMAHLGVGQSLQSHKAEDVIDHKPGSVLPDKISFSDLSFSTTFDSLAGFVTSASMSAPSWPGVPVSFYDGGRDIAYLRANMLGILTGTILDYDLLFDLYFSLDTEDNDHEINVGVCNTAMSSWDIGFRIVDGHVYGFARWSGSEHLTSSLYTITEGVVVFVRVYYDYVGGVIHFYINGDEVGTLSPTAAVSVENQFAIHIDAKTEESGVMRLYRLAFSRSML